MAKAATFRLVRHAAHGLIGRALVGRTPGVRLSEDGRAQARALAERLAGLPVDALVSSPLERAIETAEPLARALAVPIARDDAFFEIDCGAWTGLSFDELRADPDWRRWNERRAESGAPGGETMAAVQRRAVAGLEALRTRRPDGTFVIVSHSDVIKAVVCAVLGLTLDAHDRFEIGPASVTTLVAWDGGGKLVALNEGAA